MKSQKQKHLEQFLAATFTERDEFAVRFLKKVLVDFEMDFSPLPTISSKDAEKISTPLTLVGASEDIMFPGDKLLKRGKKIFPSLEKSVLLHNSKHVQNTSDNRRIEKMILT